MFPNPYQNLSSESAEAPPYSGSAGSCYPPPSFHSGSADSRYPPPPPHPGHSYIEKKAEKKGCIIEVNLHDSDSSGHRAWLLTIESLDIPHNGVSISSYLSFVNSQDMTGIRRHVRDLGYDMEAIVIKQLTSLIDATRSMFFLQDLGFCDKRSFSFLMVLASYIAETGGTHLDVMETFGVRGISEAYMHTDGKKVSIGMMCKLFGLTKSRDMRRMDCPRVWDLETDKVVNNPNFGGDSVYQIAAITHRWQEKEFVYKDLMKIEQTNAILEKLDKPLESTKISTKSDKLAKIREELKDQVRYVWMDTLCINKDSSTELDMSIRSMYRWYSNAAFVYLEYYTNFREWCTRGWTLQEGHAAKSLHVSPKHGKFFMELVANISENECRKLALNERSGHRGSFYWLGLMESRRTTVVEDKIYALIGILGVDFQIAYGEGGRAVDRMCEEIAKQKGDVSWLATTRYRDATNVRKRPVPMNEIWNVRTSDSPSRYEVQVTSVGMKLEVLDISSLEDWTCNHYKERTNCEVGIGDGEYYYIPSDNILLVVKNDGQGFHRICGARCLGATFTDCDKKTITLDYKYFENKNNSMLGRRES